MKTKKIVAESMPVALKMVRQQLGEDAIIVNTKVVKTGGLFGFFTKQKFEVTAYSVEKDSSAPEPKFTLPQIEKTIQTDRNKMVQENKTEDLETNTTVFHKQPQKLYQYYSKEIAPKEKTVSSTKDLKNEDILLEEMQQMRKMMMNYIISDSQKSSLPRGFVKWNNHLKKQGVSEEVVEYILNRILLKFESKNSLNDQAIENEISSIIVEIIEKRIPESIAVQDKTRMINLIGPTGVGKTTTIAKLATEQVLKQKRKVAMITTDVYRIAAVEQLKTYAVILGVPVEVVRSIDELEKALKKLESYDLIYMDTTGRNYKDAEYRTSIMEYMNLPIESDQYLVLSLTTKYEDLQLLLDEFSESPVNRLILTKFDETTSYGSILNIAYKYPYQLTYITNGQSVPEDIVAIDAPLLARKLLGRE
ncbi:flagellar biosynthesis protein FlhF [Neobacillus niacini]|uniref:flagellar biosynthesis protein FlhF n=1 Tax=Neobacillus niacini TaxID=86668 RepID=UPI002858719D|nr:flagellar biosynthesis protein FlhF [Neobacillus niacini]MDR7000953.1 flagellar biosynthesis protein FlhF [Neobacillus niacini]